MFRISWLFLLFSILGEGEAEQRGGGSILSNALPGLEQPGLEGGRESCDRLVADVAKADQDTDAEFPPKVAGKWVSEGCEIRSGPEYILRSYTIYRNHSFRLLQYHYGDASCTSPQFVVTARGRLKVRGRSWVTPGAAEADYWLEKVSVFAHRSSAADDLARKVNLTCPGSVRRRWRPYREYVVLNLAPDEGEYWEDHSKNSANKAETKSSRKHRVLRPQGPVSDELDCADGVLPASMHELQLLRGQRRPASSPDHRHARVELLLGDVHSRPEMRLSYRPTAYQVPLLRADQSPSCTICRVVARASERSPPHLPAKARLPVFLSGEWVSSRCETRPLGMFLTRRLRFTQQRGRRWAGDFHYFSDSSCSMATFTAHATGRFSIGRESARVQSGTELEFRVDTAAVAIHDHSIVNGLNSVGSNCGAKGVWQLDELQDVTSTGGCSPLGISVPIVERELLKVEVDNNGVPLLFMGQTDTERGAESSNGEVIRPTAYQAPLMQCRSNDDLMILTHHSHRALPPVVMSNQLYPIPHARTALSHTSRHLVSLVLFLVSAVCVTLM